MYGKSAWECGNLGGKTKNVGNQGSDAGNRGGNLSVAVQIIWNSNGNDKLKERLERSQNNKLTFTHLTWCLSC